MPKPTWPEILDRYIETSVSVSRATVADKTGVDVSTVGRWLQAKQYPKDEQVEKLTGLLGVTEDELVAAFYEAKRRRSPADRLDDLEERVQALERLASAPRRSRRAP